MKAAYYSSACRSTIRFIVIPDLSVIGYDPNQLIQADFPLAKYSDLRLAGRLYFGEDLRSKSGLVAKDKDFLAPQFLNADGVPGGIAKLDFKHIRS